MGDPAEATSVLVLNAGSSSIKFAVFDEALSETLSGKADSIGGASQLRVGDEERETPLSDHRAALEAILNALSERGVTPNTLRAVGHRVVHGGRKLTKPMRVTDEVRNEIANCTPLAPLHNPHNLAPMEALSRLAPNVPQFASFDTSFHATNQIGRASCRARV